ncbi:unnamed protein product [Kluyveromyces dobzhanskii CBS 2104]|uniref:WGS project CCBQ000000000 data, contig 00014 n=1 Tax=Kluyveromyces dobzhanskii CBS 2104 TaxID=1427455 RepID=A0A0A8L8S0_9SACH|nr:unnamed protein product [Kluyveromyces dobzhanskii CBS 2104]
MSNQVVLITGASSGIGLSTAKTLLDAGYQVYGTSRKGQVPGKEFPFHMVKLDVTDEKSVADAVEEVISKAGKIDVLVNNAGIALKWGAVEECSTELARTIFETNFFGIHRMTRAVVPHMRAKGYGRIVNISSVAGFSPVPYMALYCSTKHAVEGYSESLDHELKGLGIRVSTVEPGMIKTDMGDANLPVDEEVPVYKEIKTKLEKSIEKQGTEEPKVIAAAVLKIIRSKNPKTRNAVGKAKLFSYLHSYSPGWLFDRILDGFYGN